MYVTGKTIVVTGGGNGIGRELVLNLLGRGANVAAVDMNEAALQETAKLAGNKSDYLSLHVLNVTDKDAISHFPEQVIAKHGAVDGIINNAGIIQPFISVADLDYTVIERVMNVNFYGTLYLTKAFLPHFLKRPEAHVVNISSMGGFLPVPGQSIYGAAKAAIKLMTEGMRSELLETNVNVTVVFPGAVGTNIIVNSGAGTMRAEDAPQKGPIRPLPPAKAAEIIVDGMEKNRFRVFVGSDSKFLDFLYRLAPTFAANFIQKQMKAHIPG